VSVFEDSPNSVCPTCLASNLLTEIKIARCVKCFKLYCTHFASTIDPLYCVECLSDITLFKETMTKTYERTDEEGNVTSTYKKRAKHVRLEGLNWLFSQRKIISLSDDELELSIEYHREILSGMLDERETRKNAYMHRFANAPLPKKEGGTEASVTTKTTKRIKSTTEGAKVSSVLKAMMASGMTPQQIMEMLSK